MPVGEGKSLLSWARAPVPVNRIGAMTMQDVAKHRTPEDAWMVLRGVVYNVTPFLEYHPGGAEILFKCAGRDGTALFNKYHSWVNPEALLEKVAVGFIAESKDSGKG